MDLNVKFMHPTDGRLLTVELDDEITAQEAIAELIAADFIPSTPAGYSLAIKGGALLGPVDSFASRSIEKNSILRVIPNTDAGGAPLSTPQLSQNNHSGVPGLDGSSIPRFSIDEVRQSPAATIMLVNMYDDLLLKHEKMATELDHERSKSRDRFVSSILLLVYRANTNFSVFTRRQWRSFPSATIVGHHDIGSGDERNSRKPL
ncbi:hypothetical protein ThidrDRAFT_4405 [Thiorhodococcus drewsii AZ1]|uniref:Ubiquitin-like domain-containing protein n=1 Tax=Thiorhodococcus drewsii AZ1 TaxID=765913 RepID=G2E7Z1_9GAMM|nr:hypothetical protein [Thiorhodococcus drewsii]EGV27768.1 hypothetical protein ThidrDRAFT_4405 [Thiorhodococcus drewsii AZ1]